MFHRLSAGYHVGSNPVRRIALGDLIPTWQREMFRRVEGMPGHTALTGTLGFVDYVQRDASLQTPSGLLWGPAFKVLLIGVEPHCQRAGYGSRLLEEAQRVALEEESAFVLIDSCNDASRGLAGKLGYWEVPRTRVTYNGFFCADMAKEF